MTLPGAQGIVLISFEPIQRRASIHVEVLNLATDPSKAIVAVGLKLGSMLVGMRQVRSVVIASLAGRCAHPGLVCYLRQTVPLS